MILSSKVFEVPQLLPKFRRTGRHSNPGSAPVQDMRAQSWAYRAVEGSIWGVTRGTYWTARGLLTATRGASSVLSTCVAPRRARSAAGRSDAGRSDDSRGGAKGSGSDSEGDGGEGDGGDSDGLRARPADAGLTSAVQRGHVPGAHWSAFETDCVGLSSAALAAGVVQRAGGWQTRQAVLLLE